MIDATVGQKKIVWQMKQYHQGFFSAFFGKHRICGFAGFLSFWQNSGLSFWKFVEFLEISHKFGPNRRFLGPFLSFYSKLSQNLPVSWVFGQKFLEFWLKFLEFWQLFPWVWVFYPLSLCANAEKKPWYIYVHLCFMLMYAYLCLHSLCFIRNAL